MNKHLLFSGVTNATTIIYGEARYYCHLIRNSPAALPSLPNPFAVSCVLSAALKAGLLPIISLLLIGLLCRPP